MEEFRKKIERKVRVCAVVCCFFPITLILAATVLKRFVPVGGDTGDYARGIVFGVCTGSVAVFVVYLVQLFTALHNEEKLKQMYINRTDERNIAIDRASSSATCVITAVVLALASIVAGFINETVSVTLSAAVFLFAFIRFAVGIYYNKKM